MDNNIITVETKRFQVFEVSKSLVWEGNTYMIEEILECQPVFGGGIKVRIKVKNN